MCPKSLVPTLPFLFRSVAHQRKVFDGPLGEELLQACDHQGLVGLAFYDAGARSLYARRPVKTLADAWPSMRTAWAVRYGAPIASIFCIDTSLA